MKRWPSAMRSFCQPAASCEITRHSAAIRSGDWGDGHFIGVVRVLDRICRKAKLEGMTPHVLRHTFASVAATWASPNLLSRVCLGIPRAASRKGTCTWIPPWSSQPTASRWKSQGCWVGRRHQSDQTLISDEYPVASLARAGQQPLDEMEFSSLTIDFTRGQS